MLQKISRLEKKSNAAIVKYLSKNKRLMEKNYKKQQKIRYKKSEKYITFQYVWNEMIKIHFKSIFFYFIMTKKYL